MKTLQTLALTFVIATALCAAPMHAQDDDLDVLLDRLTMYLETYERALSSVIADEHYVQEANRSRLRERRVTDSEVLFLRLPGEAEWFGVRDTKKVDGKAVEGTGVSLPELLKNPGPDLLARAAAIVEASSRHNLGGRRTINMPTVPLEALSARNHPRLIFKVGDRSRISGTRVRRLEFEEFEEPTLVKSADGRNLWSRGSAWIDPTTGALWRAELTVGPDRPGTYRRRELESRIRVEFVMEPQWQMLVPKELVENFWIRGGLGLGRGRYSNYRKFETTARIIPGR